MSYRHKKWIVRALHLLTFPFSLISLVAYRRWGSEAPFQFSARLLSLVPGYLGRYLRCSFYVVTLPACAHDLAVDFCSWFAHPTARVGRGVVIASFSIIGTATLADEVLVASRVSVLSGKQQHPRGGDGGRGGQPRYQRVTVGKGSWLGEGCVVMADVGARCVVSAGSVVTRPMPDHASAVGNPARFMRLSEEAA
ncbi:acyltransferase [Alkalilimnicola sp. S0819]|uniref:acyltransferase n=1 Tax=Alkalilimnicola sp. S0819 TaxID=2613922 RepID=UPI00126220EE|nr:acyltransferase [Alkalilimnicola sp. S0819]KAB7622852.1 acyltransferase [Alkalilimnicola sp. S0819]MPQ17174.1 acyltransferase [Alkalilimnicola sp. S0819]